MHHKDWKLTQRRTSSLRTIRNASIPNVAKTFKNDIIRGRRNLERLVKIDFLGQSDRGRRRL